MQFVVALPPSCLSRGFAAFTLRYTYARLSASVFGPDVNVLPRTVADAALRAAVVDLHLIRSPVAVFTFQPFGKSPCLSTPRRAICASLNGGAAVDNGY